MDKFLITSNIIEKYYLNNEIIFIDESCIINLENSELPTKKIKVAEDILEDFKKKNIEFYEDLLHLHSLVLEKLADTLNEYHNLNYNKKFWRILIDPFLIDYITNLFFKIKKIDKALLLSQDLKYVVYEKLYEYPKTYDYLEYENQLRGDLYQQYVYQKIITQEFKSNINFIYEKNFPNDKKYKYEIMYLERKVKDFNPLNLKIFSNVEKSLTKKLTKKTAYFFDTLLGTLIKNYSVVFLSIKMPKLSFIKLCLSLRTIPRFFFKDFDGNKIEKGIYKITERNKIKIKISPKSKIENYIKNNINYDLPITLVEDFNKYKDFCSNIKIYSKKIVFDNVVYGSELYKFWIASKSLDKSIKLISCQHGGSLKLMEENFDFEDKISDLRYVWHKDSNKNRIQLPPLKLADSKKIKKNINGDCLLVPYASDLYCTRIDFCPNDFRALKHVEQYKILYENLHEKIKKQFKIKLDISKGLNEEKYIRRFVEDKKFLKDQNLFSAFRKSKIIICTYPETTFIEALATDIPTILIYPEKYWIFDNNILELIDKLIDAKIIFHNPKEASIHLNNIWDNPMLWWESDKVKNILSETFDKIGNPFNINWIVEWKKELGKI